jgi:ubiquinone/menaquinone biosynthesis C-methylase UbiE
VAPGNGFADHFSSFSPDYAKYRPDYPACLFAYLAGLAPAMRSAWDCATGSGQAAVGLARHFARVIATDASAAQLESARPNPRIEYRLAAAEDSGLPPGSVDLVTAAQALHWFDRPRFWSEVDRVLVERGIVAVWCYDLLRTDPRIDVVIGRLYRDIVGPYWPPERVLTEERYRTIEFPFEELEPPPFRMELHWTLSDLLGYLRTWSAARRYAAATGEDPILLVEQDLARAWGPPDRPRAILWDLALRIGRKT